MTVDGMREPLFSRIWPGFWRDVILNGAVASPLVPRPIRWRLLKLFGAEVDKSRISPMVWFGNTNFAIGSGSFINYGCMFNSRARITIGQRTAVGMNVNFVTSTHIIGTEMQRAGDPIERPITIGDGVWIGAGATILPGVSVGDGCIIGAGAVVTSDCLKNGLYFGVPAKRVRELSNDDS